MQNKILFFQSTSIGGAGNTPGLLELLFAHLDSLELKIFELQQIIVPSTAIAIWLKDQIAIRYGICANLDCVVLPGPVLDNIYYANNPDFTPFSFAQAKYIIYNYLCHAKLEDADELNNYIYVDDVLDKLRTYQLSVQLQMIFHEYIYLRTDDIINLDKSAIKPWQKKVIEHLFGQIGQAKTFIDVYKYFMQTDLDQVKLPKNLIIFGLTSIYPSQLHLLGRLSVKLNLHWYYQTSSYQYYGDLLSDKAKSHLERKSLKNPGLSLDDLYLLDGNPLLANLAQQSREFSELLIANDIDVYAFRQHQTLDAKTILQQIQDDIRNIQYRVHADYRLGNDPNIYADPVDLSHMLVGDNIYDLPRQQTSIKINICHNRMREVQVMFNELIGVLNNNQDSTLGDILITAPDIDEYAPYITAVFDNEAIGRERLLYNITGNRKYKNYKILETIQLLLNAPYVLTANYFIEILIQSEIQDRLELSYADVERVRAWLYDNNIHFGYNENDYASLGYVDYPIHSFKQFLNNIVLGACISDNVWQGRVPLYEQGTYVPYDNLDNNQVKLCNKLILLINQLEELRNKFYADENTHNELRVNEIHMILTNLNNNCLNNKNSINNFERFLGELLIIPEDLIITLPILNLIFNEYIDDFKSSIIFNGSITCASMRYMRNIPFKHIYVLGLNFGEYPHIHTPNQLSLLAHDWYLADRNYTLEDKQTFLDILLSCKEQLYLSYIGRRETDNSKVPPSPLLGLVINTLGQSFTNFSLVQTNNDVAINAEIKYDFKNLVVQQALHPFYNNSQPNYSMLWSYIAKAQDSFRDNAWDFNQVSPGVITDMTEFYQLKMENVIKLFLYSNVNLYHVLGIRRFNYELELNDTESFNLIERNLAAQVEKYFKKYLGAKDITENNLEQLQKLLINSGVLGYKHIGQMQFNYYYQLYNKYLTLQGKIRAHLNFKYTVSEEINLTLDDEVYLDGARVIVTDSFVNIVVNILAAKVDDLPYGLKIRGIFIYLLCFGGAVISVQDRVQVVEEVIIRQISVNGEYRDFKIGVDDIQAMLNRIFRYYVRSLSNPVLVHRAAIVEYARLAKENKPYNTCFEGARAKYLGDYENHELDKIRKDIIFCSIAENYFEFMQEINGVNDIIRIGEIISKLDMS